MVETGFPPVRKLVATMDRPHRAWTAIIWTAFVLLSVGFVAAWLGARARPPAADTLPLAVQDATATDLPRLYEVPQFSLIDQKARPLTQQQLRGGVWIAAFIFTRCTGPCPVITHNIASDLQPALTGSAVKLVSFSLDPTYDTPTVLSTYAHDNHADETRWSFLTGKSSTIYDVAKGMKLTAIPTDGTNPIMHSTRLVLVDQNSWIRGYYDSMDSQSLKKLAADARKLAGETATPTTEPIARD
jgi:protein SCO1/2